MRNTSKIKRVLALCLIFLLSINSFAAIVSDNDGSAFVTKAEFDALKNSFAKQIDDYNTSIEGKIDGAIASYLAGIRTATTTPTNLLFPVSPGDLNKVLTVPNKYNGIRTQSFQGGVFLQSWFALHSLNESTTVWQPFDTTQASWKTSVNWTQHSILGQSPYDQMEGWTFSSTNPEILLQKWGYDNCKLNLAITSTHNQNWGHGGNGERFIMGLQPGYFTGRFIDVLYDDTTKIGHSSKVYGGGTPESNPWIEDSDTVSDATIKSYWSDTIPIPNSFKTSHARITQWGNAVGYDETVKLATVLITHETKNPDNNIYIYNYCKDVINAHDQDETALEEYTDYGTDVATGDEIGGYNTNLYLSNRSECWAWWSPSHDGTNFDLNNHVASRKIGTRRNWRFTPKFKLKNTNATVPPNTASTTGGTKYWNTLDQFRNGKLTFKSSNGTEITPHFYGGLPLYSFDDSKVDEFKFDIKMADDTASPLLATNSVCLQIKEDEFPNSVDISTWTNEEKNKLIEFEGQEGSTKLAYDNTNKCLKITLDKQATITIKKPKKGSNIFLRWWESTTKNACGKIEFLGDATLINNNE